MSLHTIYESYNVMFVSVFLFLQIPVALAHASMLWGDRTFVNVPLEDWEVAASTLTLAAMEHVAMQARTVSIV